MHCGMFSQCRQGGWGKSVTRQSEVGPWRCYVAYDFVLLGSMVTCSLYNLTLADQSQVILQLTVSLCYLL